MLTFFCFSCANPLSKFIDAALTIQALQPQDPQRVIVDTTAQEKAVAHPTPITACRRSLATR
jgi:hypothetical protein